jgi:hypothetical protein
MEPCDSCKQLEDPAARVGVPRHLARLEAGRRNGKAHFRYQCESCGIEWDWKHGTGWCHEGGSGTDSKPLLARLMDVARSKLGRPQA